MKKLKIMIIILIFLIIITVISIVVVKKLDKTTNNDAMEIISESDYDTKIQEEEMHTMSEQEEKDMVYTVEQCINSYLDFINTNNTSYYGYDENNNYTKLVDENEKIYNLLSVEYIEGNNITTNNVDNFIQKVDDKMFFIPLDMKYVKNENMYKYAVYGFTTDMEYNFISKEYLIVNMDFNNYTFSIEPVNRSYNSIEDIEIENTLTEIESNEDNTFRYVQAKAETVAKKYMDYYKKLVLSNPEEAYDHLDEEYRDKRFGSLEEFEKYINNNRDFLLSLQPQRYLLNSYDEYSEYVCMDKYNNLYIFREYGPLDYKILLDTYTITTDKFKAEYDSADEQNKVAMNIDKWVQMLNNRDYKAAYSVLDETFRNNNWGSVDAFEQYMRENFPLYYKVEYTTFRDENSTYIQEIVLSDITGENDSTITVNVIMQLKDNYEFVMSFSTE